ncbi:MAG: PAS domain-containing sensor histidine kinase, partial [Verrucomicrobia bacterium]
YFNQAVTRLLGLQPSVAEGQPLSRFLPELEWEKILAAAGTAGQTVVRHEFEVAFPRPRFLSLYVAPLDGEARDGSGVALIIHDTTEARKKTFAAIESERTQALTLLAASVAHEIGNPLNALHIHLQLIERALRKMKGYLSKPFGHQTPGSARPVMPDEETDDLLAKIDNYLTVAKGEVVRLDYIITQFLQAIRPSPPQLRPASLNDVVKETLGLLKPEIENRGLTVVEKLARRLPMSAIDRAQVKQALVNLVKNAIQAMTRGGELTLQTDYNAEGLWVSVGDTGGGIPAEQINRIFEPFFTTKKKGSGLGLMIVQRIVRDHAGRIEVESHVGKGTTFRIWLPRHERLPRLLEAGRK